MAHISFDASKLEKFVHDNELTEMQALVNASDDQLRQGTGAGSDFRDWLTLLRILIKKSSLELKLLQSRFNQIRKF